MVEWRSKHTEIRRQLYSKASTVSRTGSISASTPEADAVDKSPNPKFGRNSPRVSPMPAEKGADASALPSRSPSQRGRHRNRVVPMTEESHESKSTTMNHAANESTNQEPVVPNSPAVVVAQKQAKTDETLAVKRLHIGPKRKKHLRSDLLVEPVQAASEAASLPRIAAKTDSVPHPTTTGPKRRSSAWISGESSATVEAESEALPSVSAAASAQKDAVVGENDIKVLKFHSTKELTVQTDSASSTQHPKLHAKPSTSLVKLQSSFLERMGSFRNLRRRTSSLPHENRLVSNIVKDRKKHKMSKYKIREMELQAYKDMKTHRFMMLALSYAALFFFAFLSLYINFIFGVKFDVQTQQRWLQVHTTGFSL